MRTRVRKAAHEAAHAVMADLRGVGVGRIGLRRDTEFFDEDAELAASMVGAASEGLQGLGAAERAEAETRFLVYAGPWFASRVLHGRALPRDRADYEKAKRLLRRVSPRQPRPRAEMGEAEAHRVAFDEMAHRAVSSAGRDGCPQPALMVALAKRLCEAAGGTMDGDEVHRAIAELRRTYPAWEQQVIAWWQPHQQRQ